MITMAGVWVLRLVAVTAVVTSSLGFVLRRRDWEDDANAGLAEALPVLREERRRLEEPLDGATSFWEEPEELTEEEEEVLDMQPRLNNGELLDSLLGEESNDIGEYFMPGMGFDGEEEEEEEREEENNVDNDDENSINEITESPADLKELETILEPSDDEKVEEEEEEESISKKNIPIALGGPGPERPKRAQKNNEGMSDLSSLLEKTAEKLEDEALLKSVSKAIEEEEEREDDPTPVPVSKDELQTLLSDEDEDDEDNEELRDSDEEDVLPWKRTQGEVMPVLSYSPIVPLKIKRSRRNFRAADSDSAANDGSAAREYIRRFLELEDDENTNLANALNLATMAQVQRDDKLVLPEAKFIKKAIEDEQAIQELRAELSGSPEAEPRPIVAAAEAIGKREMQFEPEEELFEEELEDEDDGEDSDEGQEVEYFPEEDEENMIQEIEQPATDLAQKLRDYLEHTSSLQRENEVDDEAPLQRGAWLDRPIEMGQEGITEDEWELNPLIRELYQRYSAGQLTKRVVELGPEVEEYEPLEDEQEEDVEEEEEEEEEEPSPAEIEEMEREIENTLEGFIEARELKNALQQEEELEEEEGGLCPAVELVDGCKYAVGNLGLKLDAEAMDLCNRHQLCYTCGSVHGMTASDCDNGYLREANRLCEAEGNEDDCSTDAAGLFILMLQSHQFYADQGEAPAACLNPCAMDYIVGLDKK